LTDSFYIFFLNFRYDWFQTDGTVNIVVHTKRKIPSVGCAVVDLQDDTLRVDILLGKMSYLLYWRGSFCTSPATET
ncbi:hypothetical protein cypCar_00047810, partial [Cyprinus carpio]